MLAQPPLSANPELHAGIAKRLDDIVELARAELGDKLKTVLLGGSLARGEALGVSEGLGLRLLSDLDMYFVADGEGANLRQAINRYFGEDEFLVAPPDVAVVPLSFFADSASAMPTHQLAHAHRVLWGEPVQIRGARAADGRPDVDSRDAGELLFNRFVESLDPRMEEDLPRLMHRTKEFIDAPMAWLGSIGEYTPDRVLQIQRMRELCSGWERAASERLEQALQHWAACLRARDEGVVDRARLEQLAGESGGYPAWQDWTGGLAMALLTGGGTAVLESSLRDGLDRPGLDEACRGWLRREPLVARLRRARRWSSIAPGEVTGWRSHGFGGSGPDRIFAAACLRYHGLDDWASPLAALTHEPLTDPADVHALWWRWIQGRDDDA